MRWMIAGYAAAEQVWYSWMISYNVQKRTQAANSRELDVSCFKLQAAA